MYAGYDVSVYLQSFASCQYKAVSVGTQLPFCLDVSRATFEQLDCLLRRVCEGLSEERGALSQPPHERECMAVAALNLLKLQVRLLLSLSLPLPPSIFHLLTYPLPDSFSNSPTYMYLSLSPSPSLNPKLYVAISEQVPPETLGLQSSSTQTSSPLLSSIKQCVVKLARSSSVIGSIQSAAQSVLRSGWLLLLPTVSERASTLSQLLPTRDGGCGFYQLMNIHKCVLRRTTLIRISLSSSLPRSRCSPASRSTVHDRPASGQPNGRPGSRGCPGHCHSGRGEGQVPCVPARGTWRGHRATA